MPNAYDHRLRELVCETKDVGLAVRMGVPVSTARSWIRRGTREVITSSVFDSDLQRLQRRVLELEQRLSRLVGIIRLLVVLVRLGGGRLDCERVPNGEDKVKVMAVVDKVIGVLPLRHALHVLGLTRERYWAWRRKESRCELNDEVSCPRSRPTRLTQSEKDSMREMVTSMAFRHMSVRALALHAQRIGKVLAAPGTWLRQIKENSWIRPRRRLYPAKPKVGVRTSTPNELWQIDVTIIKLLDGTKLYLHGIIDNFSRKLLAWELATKLDPTTTCRVLAEAGKHLETGVPTVACDKGSENVNGEVDDLVSAGRLNRILAQIEVSYSNSMIEAWWRSLKNGWLFLNTLDSFAAVEKLVAFYVGQHNTTMPHAAFNGQTPDEVYYRTAPNLADELAERRRQARAERIAVNRRLTCSGCEASQGESASVASEAA